MVFVDTGAWFAKFVPEDPNHGRVSAWFASNVAGRVLFDGSLVRLHFVTADEAYRAWILFQQRAASGWSFTDCTSKNRLRRLANLHRRRAR